ncbi:MAG TPA: ATP-binding protein, partial [Urbifossiella sp.]|nr:ATP-binding protein [Urbifossiella sp.]
SRQAVEAGGHALDVRLPAGPLPLDADRTRLTQVLANLLNNAAKYTPAGGRVTLAAGAEGADAVVRVTDTGVGIPAEMLPHIFDMFTQVGSSLDRAQGGLGIGLTLVRRLAELHGGTVTASSPGAGRGSEFVLRLPRAAEAPAPAAPAPAAADPGGPLSVLVVDDNRDSADTLAALLALKGHAARTAYDGPGALRALETLRPDLILLDLGLPGMTGYEVARRVRGSPGLRGVAIAALTGWGQEEDRRRTKEAGFDYHLVKPADLDAVDEILAGLGRPRGPGRAGDPPAAGWRAIPAAARSSCSPRRPSTEPIAGLYYPSPATGRCGSVPGGTVSPPFVARAPAQPPTPRGAGCENICVRGKSVSGFGAQSRLTPVHDPAGVPSVSVLEDEGITDAWEHNCRVRIRLTIVPRAESGSLLVPNDEDADPSKPRRHQGRVSASPAHRVRLCRYRPTRFRWPISPRTNSSGWIWFTPSTRPGRGMTYGFRSAARSRRVREPRY